MTTKNTSLDQATASAVERTLAAVWPELAALPFLELRFRVHSARPWRPPLFFGSTLRGVFGHALKEAACIRADGDCHACTFTQSCLYPKLFEPGLAKSASRANLEMSATDPVQTRSASRARGPATPPPPFVFHWRVDPRGRVANPRREHQFGMTLFGPAVPHAGYVLGALRRGLQKGVGRERNRIRIEEIHAVALDGALCSRFDGVFALGDLAAVSPPLSRRVMLRFHTPLSLRKDGRPLRRVEFVDIVQAAIRRLRLLAPAYPESARAWARDLLQKAEHIRVVCPRLRWQRLERRSARHDNASRFSGLVGELIVEGELAPFSELLALACRTHIGRHTNFGLGRLSLPRCARRTRQEARDDASADRTRPSATAAVESQS